MQVRTIICKMGKRRVILLFAIVVLLVGVIAFFYLKLFSSGDNGGSVDSTEIASLSTIPNDASLVLLFNDKYTIESLIGEGALTEPLFVRDEKSRLMELLQKFISQLEEGEFTSAATISLHSTIPGRFSTLISLDIPNNYSKSELLDLVKSIKSNIKKDSYSEKDFYTIPNQNVYFTFLDDAMAFSDSKVLLESSIRHSSQDVSILGNEFFVNSLNGAKSGDVILLYNHEATSNIFSAYVDIKYIGYSSVVENISSWSTITLHLGDNSFVGTGLLNNDAGNKKFEKVVASQSGEKGNMAKYLPFYTHLFYSIKLTDTEKFISDYNTFLEANRRKLSFDRFRDTLTSISSDEKKSIEKLFADFGKNKRFPKIEVGRAAFVVGKRLEWVNMLNVEGLEDTLSAGEVDYMAMKFGNFFKAKSEECIKLDGWHISGSKVAMDEYRQGKATFLSLYDYMVENQVVTQLDDNSVVSFFCNFDQAYNHKVTLLNSNYQPSLDRVLEASNLEVFSLDLFSASKEGAIEVSFDRKSVDAVLMDIERDTTVVIPTGPFEFKELSSGKKRYLYQTPNLFLRYSDENRKPVWSAPFTTHICGAVEGIDYYKNGKTQMLFASENKLYLLDMTGRFVSGFPKPVEKNILIGPKVYDPFDDKDYRVMLLFKDNTLGLYNVNGVSDPKWGGFKPKEKIKKLPELLKVNDKLYWVLRTSIQTYILDYSGQPVAQFEGYKRVRPDSKIEVISSNEVVLSLFDKKNWILNLDSGIFTEFE